MKQRKGRIKNRNTTTSRQMRKVGKPHRTRFAAEAMSLATEMLRLANRLLGS